MAALDNLFGLRRVLVDGEPVLDAAGLELFAQTFDLLGGWTIELGEDADHKPTLKLTPPAGGPGDVEGPGASVDGRIAIWSGTGGDTLADGGTTIAALQAAADAALFPNIITCADPTLTLVRATHAGKRILYTNAGGCVVTVNSGVFSANDWVDHIQGAAGQVSFAGSATLSPPASFDPITAELGALISTLFTSGSAGRLLGQLELA